MAKVRVAVLGSVGKSVLIDTDLEARVRALEQVATTAPTAGRHSELSGLQVGDDHPQYTMWQAAERIKAPWVFDANVTWTDGNEAKFGTDGDLRIFHTGAAAAIGNSTGPLGITALAGDLDLTASADVDILAGANLDISATLVNINGVELTELIRDTIGATLTDTASIDLVYNDGSNTISANLIDEYAQDLVGAMLVDSTSIDFSYNDGAGTATASVITANPSGLIGMAAVNGTAATPLRSDGRHAIDPAITPEWTGTHGWADNAEVQLGTGNDLRLFHDGTNSFIRNDTGELRLSMAGTTRLTLGTAAITGTLPFVAPAGLVSAPSFSLGGGNGMYLSAANVVSLAAGGSQIFEFAANTSGVAMYAGSTAASISLAVYNLAASVNGLIVYADGRVRLPVGPLQIADGITAPATQAGFAQIYVDTADGDLKVKFGDGTVKTIVTD